MVLDDLMLGDVFRDWNVSKQGKTLHAMPKSLSIRHFLSAVTAFRLLWGGSASLDLQGQSSVAKESQSKAINYHLNTHQTLKAKSKA